MFPLSHCYRRGLFGLVLAAVALPFHASAQVAAPKLDARLRTAPAGSVVPVFIRLVDQPGPRILAAVEARYQAQSALAEDRYRRAASLQFLVPGELESAAAELDTVTLQIRHTAAREMADAVQWEQDLMETSLRSRGATNIQRFFIVNLLRADVPAEALTALEAEPAIARIAPVGQRHSRINISVPSIGASAFWSNFTPFTGMGQAVAIIDTGLNTAPSHPAFGGRITATNNTISPPPTVVCANPMDNTDTVDRFGHGTHVTGIAVSGGAPGWQNYLGVAKGATKIYMAKAGCTVMGQPNNTATFEDNDLIAGMQWILSQTPAKIVNLSVGAPAGQDDDFLAGTIDQLAYANDVLFTVAAGNNGGSDLSPPPNLDSPGIAYNILCVAAMDTHFTPTHSDDTVAIFSSSGPTPGGRKKPDIAAPGEATIQGMPSGIYSADNVTFGFVQKRGTSMAAPHMAGAAGLVRQAGVTNSLAIKALLLNSVGSPFWIPATGWGYVDLNIALGQVFNTLTGSIAPAAFQLYSGPTGLSTVTLVWDRNPPHALTNLDLFLYDRNGGGLAAVSNSAIDNVEKVSASPTGGSVIKVKNVASAVPGAERFALAWSNPALTSAAGPSLAVNCSGPAIVAPNSIQTFSCTVHNNGDLEAFAVNSTLALVGGGSGTNMALGTIAPTGSATGNWSVTAPANAGQYTLQNNVASTSYGESFTTSNTVNFAVCTYNISPANHVALPLSESNDSVSMTAPQFCSWSATTNDYWITVLSGWGSGNSSVTYSVAANTTSSARNGTINIAGLGFSVTQPCAFCGSSPVPADGATHAPVVPTLSWPAVGGATSYDLALSTTNPPAVLATGIASNSYPITTPLLAATKYYWYVVAKNSSGSAQSPTWSFTTSVVSKPGVFRQGFLWVLDGNGNHAIDDGPSPGPYVFGFGGLTGDIPVWGDWNGDGKAKPGFVRNGNQFWLDQNGNHMADDPVYTFGGIPGDIPVVGDWTGNGKTKIGMYRHGVWILDLNGDGIENDGPAFGFGGIATDIPVVGDWYGDGKSKAGVFRDGFLWVLDYDGTHNNPVVFAYGGIAGDRPVVGDWTGTGVSQVGIFRQGFLWVLDANGNHAMDDGPSPGPFIFPFGGITGDVPVTGKW